MTVSVPSWAPKVKYHYLSSANPGSDHLHLNQGGPFNCRGFQSTPGHREQPLWYFPMMAVLPSAMILPKLWWRPPQDSWLQERWTGVHFSISFSLILWIFLLYKYWGISSFSFSFSSVQKSVNLFRWYIETRVTEKCTQINNFRFTYTHTVQVKLAKPCNSFSSWGWLCNWLSMGAWIWFRY